MLTAVKDFGNLSGGRRMGLKPKIRVSQRVCVNGSTERNEIQNTLHYNFSLYDCYKMKSYYAT